jgi:hypothetical protein
MAWQAALSRRVKSGRNWIEGRDKRAWELERASSVSSPGIISKRLFSQKSVCDRNARSKE